MVNTSHQAQNYQRLRQQTNPVYSGWWAYEGKYRYPEHPRQKELAENYESAREKYKNAVEVLQYAFKRRADPNVKKHEVSDEELEKCQNAVTAAEEAVARTSRELKAFIDQTPEERTALLTSEIEDFQSQLEEAQKAEFEFTQSLLNDPDAARSRLERILKGYSGQDAEYSPQQLSELRSLKRKVEAIKSKIYSHRRDIQVIRELVAEEERKAQIQAKMDEVLPTFNEACAKFEKALSDLLDVANECDIRLHTGNIKIPKTAKFQEPSYSYKNGNIYFEF